MGEKENDPANRYCLPTEGLKDLGKFGWAKRGGKLRSLFTAGTGKQRGAGLKRSDCRELPVKRLRTA